MRLSDEQFKALEPYDKNFFTMVKADYSSNVDPRGIATILKIWNDLTGQRRVVCNSCANSQGNLLRDMGKIYLADKEERENKTRISVKMPRTKRR